MFLKLARTLATTTAPKMSRILRFDGLPYKVSPTQLQDWIKDLSEINPSKVHLISNRQGLASGDAYVTFDEKSMAKTVIENCDEKNIGDSNRYVRIYEAEEEELSWHLRRQNVFKGKHSKVDLLATNICKKISQIFY